MDTTIEEPQGASPQVEDGHLKIAHEIAQAFSRLQISGNEWRVLWVILRKTYGWHKKMDCISTTQFQRETGLKRRHISRAISNLAQRNIVTKNGDSFIISYGLQKDYVRWRTITKNGDKRQTVTKNGSKSSPKLVHTKAFTKANNGRPKKETDPRVNDFKKFWNEKFLQETRAVYPIIPTKEGKLIKDLLQIYDLPYLQEMASLFFRDDEAKRRGRDIGMFKLMLARLISKRATDPLEQAKRESRQREV